MGQPGERHQANRPARMARGQRISRSASWGPRALSSASRKRCHSGETEEIASGWGPTLRRRSSQLLAATARSTLPGGSPGASSASQSTNSHG